MFIKKTFALLGATAAFMASSVSAGNVRGMYQEDGTLSEVDGITRRRVLKEDIVVVPQPTLPPSPTLPPAPIPPPTPSLKNQFVDRCMTPQFANCISAKGASFDGCTTCIYAVSLLGTVSESSVRSCGLFPCKGCVDEAAAFYACGAGRVVAPNPAPVSVPVTAPVTAPVTVPVTAPVPVPTTVVPPPGPSTCSATRPKSGDVCATGGPSWIYCCYEVNQIDGRAPMAGEGVVCSCRSSENVYMCNPGQLSVCTNVIKPEGPPIPAPITPPVSPPTEPPVAPPTEPPVTPPTEPPVTLPVADPVPQPVSPPVSGIPEFCQALPGVPQNGTSCEGVLPDDLSGGGCGGEIIFLDDNGTPERVVTAACICQKSNPVWMCTEMVETRAPAPPVAEPTPIAPDLCANIPVPSTGDACSQHFVLTQNYLQCTFMQTTRADGQVISSDQVVCDCDTRELSDPASVTWICDGTLPPIPPPSLMPVPVVTLAPVIAPIAPVPTGPIAPICPPQNQPPDDMTSCEGVLPAQLDSATCNYQQTINANGVISTYQKACSCRASTGLWSCSGGIPEIIVADPVPETLPEPVPETLPEPVPETLPETAPETLPETVPETLPETDDGPTITQPGCPPESEVIDGVPCSQYIPSGALDQTCFINFFQTQCRCASQVANPTWACRDTP